MLNILIPIAGESAFYQAENLLFPKPLYEVEGKMMIEKVVGNLSTIEKEKRFIFIVNEKDCSQHYLDNILKLLTQDKCDIIKVKTKTQGAACSCLLAIEQINNDHELIITNGDQVIEDNFNQILFNFQRQKADAGIISFPSIHPRWSFVRLDHENEVIETSEKRPISNKAIAGFYYFRKGSSFVRGAKKMIEKDARVNDAFYIAPILNELILQEKTIAIHNIQESQYHSFYSPAMVEKYHEFLNNRKSKKHYEKVLLN